MNQEAVMKAAEPDVVKVGPHGYVHGWIKVGPGSDGASATKYTEDVKRGDVIHDESGHHAILGPVKNHTASFKSFYAVKANDDGSLGKKPYTVALRLGTRNMHAGKADKIKLPSNPAARSSVK